MDEKDIFASDRLTIFVKKERVERVVENYALFGWTIESQEDNNRYEDIVDITFSRPHKIENKDELQLLQVHMEERVNDEAKLDKYKNSKTTSFGMCLGVVIFVCLLVASLGLFGVINGVFLVEIIVLFLISGILIVLECIFLPKIYKRENENYKSKKKMLEEEIVEICEKVKKITGEK